MLSNYVNENNYDLINEALLAFRIRITIDIKIGK
ncbi:Uncharacterised protein [Mycoplasmopsis pulmonis]|nr:Uncharacterised protein [Mycoplasmopsis pulmonis]